MHQEAPGHGELATAHGDGALVEIDAERQFRRMGDVAESLHVIGERDVAEAGRLLGPRHRFVDNDRVVIGEIAHEAQQFADGDARLVSGEVDIGDDERAGIDEGIARHALLALELDDRIERRARRLAPDPAPERVADLAERLRQGEDLRDALDREELLAVAGGMDLAIRHHDAEPELAGIDPGQRRNIGRDLAALLGAAHLIGDVADKPPDIRHASRSGCSVSARQPSLRPSLRSSAGESHCGRDETAMI